MRRWFWVLGVALGVLLVHVGGYWLAVGVMLGLLLARGVFAWPDLRDLCWWLYDEAASWFSFPTPARPKRVRRKRKAQGTAPQLDPAVDPYRQPPARCPTCGAGHIDQTCAPPVVVSYGDDETTGVNQGSGILAQLEMARQAGRMHFGDSNEAMAAGARKLELIRRARRAERELDKRATHRTRRRS
jgi:hypothetical protein